MESERQGKELAAKEEAKVEDKHSLVFFICAWLGVGGWSASLTHLPKNDSKNLASFFRLLSIYLFLCQKPYSPPVLLLPWNFFINLNGYWMHKFR